MIPCYSYNRPFEGSHEADVAQGENEFDTPALHRRSGRSHRVVPHWLIKVLKP